MTIRPIRLWGDPVLRTAADPVTRYGRDIDGLVRDLLDTVAAPGRAGVAAPQIGVSLRAFSYNVEGQLGYVINPEIETSAQTQTGDEGCLSVPGLWFETKRAARALVRGVDRHGDPVTVEGAGLLARCLQHETDHLNGMLFVDRLEGDRRRAALRAIREAQLGPATGAARGRH